MYTKGKCSDGSFGCIFGQALQNLTIDQDLLQKHDTKRISNLLPLIIDLSCSNITALDWCRVVQSAQDSGISWINAINSADELFPQN
jgi:hypothetical protein